MNKFELKESNISDIKKAFENYLNTCDLSEATKATRLNTAFYLIRHSDTDFIDLLISDNFEKEAKREIYNALIKYSKASNINREVANYYSHLNKLRCFLLDIDKKEGKSKTIDRVKKQNFNSDIPNPTIDQVEIYLKKWDFLENYTAQEKAINKLFLSTFPNNNKIDEVLAKVAILNDFYSTNIFSTYPVAKHIVELNIDERLAEGDLSVVQEIAEIVIEKKPRKFYSFATKYCSHHNDSVYPIYDSYVKKVLINFRNKDSFANFDNNELTDYLVFCRIINEFREFYHLERYTIKEIDKYLWLLGKQYLPNNYKK